GRGLFSLVEALTGFLANPSLLDQRHDDPRYLDARVFRDGGEDVDAGDVHCPERGARRPAERGSGHRVDLFDRVLAGFERFEHLRDAEQANVIRDEVRRVLRDDDALAETMVGEMRHAIDDGAIGVGRGNQLEQAQVSRRIEEVRAEKIAPEVVAAAFGELRDREAGRVRADDRPRTASALDALEQRAL